jgi:3-dehydroquinate synthase
MLEVQKIEINIASQKSSYPIFVGKNILSEFDKLFDLKKYSKIAILTDRNVLKFQAESFRQKLTSNLQNIQPEIVVIKPGEENKSLQTVAKIWQEFKEIGIDRKSLVIIFGGGVVGDLGGFCSSTFMRGVDFVQIPSTLLAQVDSSVGGKTGFDFLEVKNLIGTFCQPKAVFCDLEVLQTLPQRELIQGFGEVLKYGLIYDLEFWNYLQKLSNQKDFDPTKIDDQEMLKIITKCCQIKQEIVQKDEKETAGIREILNFGHTFGHAVESFSLTTKNPLFHGEAIAIGSRFALELSAKINDFDSEIKNRILDTFTKYKLPTSYNFEIKNPTQKNQIFDGLSNLLITDKKNSNGKLNWILLNQIGETKPQKGLEIEVVKEVFEENF